MSIRFSIIIPTYNGEKTIYSLLQKIKEYSDNDTTEVILIDSHSSDNTGNILKKFQTEFLHTKLISSDKHFFNHGDTRNRGARISKGEFILFFSQDAIPQSPHIFDYLL